MRKIIYLVLVMFATLSLVACNKDDIPSELDEIVKLKTPVVTISEDGLASWDEVKNATGYLYKINDEKPVHTDELEVWLKNGDSIRVKAVGDGELYDDSSYSKAQTYGEKEESELPLTPTEPSETPVGSNIYDGYSSEFSVNNYWQVSNVDAFKIKTTSLGTKVDYNKTDTWAHIYTLVDGDLTNFNTLTLDVSGNYKTLHLRVEGKNVSHEVEHYSTDGNIVNLDLSLLSYSEFLSIERVVIFPDGGSIDKGWFRINDIYFNTSYIDTPTEPEYPTYPTDTVTITYSTWMYQDPILVELVNEYNKYNNDVKIKLVSNMEKGDIVQAEYVSNAVMSGDALNLSEFVNNDYEWQNVNYALRESITYNGNVYALPTAQYFMGYFANTDIAKYAGLLDYGFTYEQLIEFVNAMESINTDIYGLASTGDMINWLPSVLDETGNIKHFLWNTGTMRIEYTSDIAYEAMEIISKLYNLNS